jgi:hypothetical protein
LCDNRPLTIIQLTTHFLAAKALKAARKTLKKIYSFINTIGIVTR